MCLQKFSTICRFSKICYWTYSSMCLQKFPPVCRFSKICHWTDTYMCLQKFPPGVQIFKNLPLDSYLSYLHVLADILPQFADFLKSATAQIPPCACRNSPLQFADISKSATGQIPRLPTCACRNYPLQFADLSEICHWTVT